MRSDYVPYDLALQIAPHLTAPNRLVCKVAAEGGLRVGDVLRLSLSDVLSAQQRKGWLWVVEQKTGKLRKVHLAGDTLERLALAAHPLSGLCFAGARDPARPRTRQAVWSQLHRVCRRLGIAVRVTPHSYRKQYAVAKVRSVGLAGLQRDFGHDNITTTMIYAFADQLPHNDSG